MRHRFHSICPYFAMFPETFVEKHLAATKFHGVVFDPFCGRGTTIFESIIRERDAAGCDIHPVAVCVSGAKSDPPTRKEVLRRLSELEEESSSSSAVDCDGDLSEFFSLCFDSTTYSQVRFLRETLSWRQDRTKATGISVSSVQRIWRAHGLRPHRVRQFKLSNDPDFVAKLRDVVGLYVDPPAHAIVLSVDEKSQIQALDRTQPGLPMKKGRLGTMTHDYKRHGTTTLFAALNVLEGKVIGRCMQRHRHQEFIRFLNAIEADIPAGRGVHVILDNYAAHKHAKVRAWLGRHERFTFHFVPTSCSWLNAVEGFFAKLSKRRLKRGVFRSIVDLQVAINRFLDETNDNPKPFTWTADPDTIIAAVKRGHQVLDSIH